MLFFGTVLSACARYYSRQFSMPNVISSNNEHDCHKTMTGRWVDRGPWLLIIHTLHILAENYTRMKLHRQNRRL